MHITYRVAPWYSCVCGTIAHVNSTLIDKMNKYEKCQWLHFTQNWLLFLVISISHVFTNYPKLVKIWLNTKSIALVFDQDFAIFTLRSKHWTLYISRLTILSWTDRCQQIWCSMCSCRDKSVYFKAVEGIFALALHGGLSCTWDHWTQDQYH